MLPDPLHPWRQLHMIAVADHRKVILLTKCIVLPQIVSCADFMEVACPGVLGCFYVCPI